MIRRDRLTMTRARFRQIWEGVWEHGTEDWYDSQAIKGCRSRSVPVLSRRDGEASVFGLGWDTAPGTSRKSDLNAGVIWRAQPVSAGYRSMSGLLEIRGRLWRLSPCWGVSVRGRTAGELSGIIHRAYQRFHFRRGVLDPGGGGDWVLKELWKPRQYFDGREHDVTGLCTPEQANLYQGAMPILSASPKARSTSPTSGAKTATAPRPRASLRRSTGSRRATSKAARYCGPRRRTSDRRATSPPSTPNSAWPSPCSPSPNSNSSPSRWWSMPTPPRA